MTGVRSGVKGSQLMRRGIPLLMTVSEGCPQVGTTGQCPLLQVTTRGAVITLSVRWSVDGRLNITLSPRCGWYNQSTLCGQYLHLPPDCRAVRSCCHSDVTDRHGITGQIVIEICPLIYFKASIMNISPIIFLYYFCKVILAKTHLLLPP